MKRFTDSQKWSDPWFRKLPYGSKLVYNFLCDICDRAGVWKPDFELANFLLGEQIDWRAFQDRMGERLLVLQNGDWLLTKFVEFQYGKLTWKCTPHKSIIQLIEKHRVNGYPEDCARVVVPNPDHAEPVEQPEEAAVIVRALPVRKTVPTKTGRATMKEVQDFCAEAGIAKEDAEWFFHKCEGAGWTNNGRPIMDWKSTLRGWRATGDILPTHKAAKKAADEKARRQTHSGGTTNSAGGATPRNNYADRPTKT